MSANFQYTLYSIRTQKMICNGNFSLLLLNLTWFKWSMCFVCFAFKKIWSTSAQHLYQLCHLRFSRFLCTLESFCFIYNGPLSMVYEYIHCILYSELLLSVQNWALSVSLNDLIMIYCNLLQSNYH